jgi:putative FmdB family regulatory protein
MPLYEYQCDVCGARFERIAKFSDPPPAECPKCGGSVHKRVSSPAFQFKGSGWYATDYQKRTGAPSSGEGSGDGKDSAKETASKDATKDAGNDSGKDAGAKDSKESAKESAKDAGKDTKASDQKAAPAKDTPSTTSSS